MKLLNLKNHKNNKNNKKLKSLGCVSCFHKTASYVRKFVEVYGIKKNGFISRLIVACSYI